jgi:hypothetical protein
MQDWAPYFRKKKLQREMAERAWSMAIGLVATFTLIVLLEGILF